MGVGRPERGSLKEARLWLNVEIWSEFIRMERKGSAFQLLVPQACQSLSGSSKLAAQQWDRRMGLQLEVPAEEA